jgi:hypothetical protein
MAVDTSYLDGRVLPLSQQGKYTRPIYITPATPHGFSFSLGPSLNTARANHTATLLPSGKVLVTGGWNNSDGNLFSCELYDPTTNSWSSTSPMNHARGYHSATLLLSGEVLAAGGEDENSNLSHTAEIYDPIEETWTPVGSMAFKRESFGLVTLGNGEGIALGGHSTPSDPIATETFDPNSNTWTTVGSLSTSREVPIAVTLLDGRALTAGGWGHTGGNTKDTEIYDPSLLQLNKWTVTGPMNIDRAGHMAVTLNDGRVLVTGGESSHRGLGGSDPITTQSQGEIFSVSSNTWSLIANASFRREAHGMALFNDGRVLVAGGNGIDNQSNPLETATAEIYDPILDSWTTVESLSSARQFLTATTLQSGKILVVGGWSTANADAFSTTDIGVWT